MAERLSDVEARIGSIRQLSAVIAAMRGIAAARTREANAQLDGIRAYAATVASAISQALALMPAGDSRPASRKAATGHVIVALCAEQGFVGAFNTHVLDAAQQLLDAGHPGGCELLLIGDRGLMNARERDLAIGWCAPMVGHAEQVTDLANRVADALYQRFDEGHVARATIVHAVPGPSDPLEIVRRTLIPFDFSRFPPSNVNLPPLVTLPPRALGAHLAEEYMFAELCEALMLSFAAENEARMRAMIAARTNVANKLTELTGEARRLRQEQITGEVIELAAGVDAGGIAAS